MLTAVPPRPALSRRRLLLAGPAAALGALAACSEPEAPPIDPDRVALESALAAEEVLAAAIAASTFDSPELRVQALAVSDRHVSELREALGAGSAGSASPAPSPSPTTAGPSTGSTDDLVRVLDQTADAHTRALRRAPASLVPFLASLAASDAALAAAVRQEAR
jgi:hypothetical protein